MFPSILEVHDFYTFFSLCFPWMISLTLNVLTSPASPKSVTPRPDLSLELQTQSALASERHPCGYPTDTHNQCVKK